MTIKVADYLFYESKPNTRSDEEYQLFERDTIQTPKLSLPVGTVVQFSRWVTRVDYMFSKHSFTKEEWYQEGVRVVAEKNNLPFGEAKKIIETLNLYSPFKGLKGEIYHRLVQHKVNQFYQDTKDGRVFWRTMWFRDFPSLRQGGIIGRARRWTGHWHPGQGGGSMYDDYDWDPPDLYPRNNQNLYEVQEFPSGLVYLVYPDDVEVL